MAESTIVRIERLKNGFEVEMTDPAIVQQNNKRDNSKGSYTPWKDPKVAYAFKTVAEVVTFLEKNLEKAMPMDEYGSSFDAAVASNEDD